MTELLTRVGDEHKNCKERAEQLKNENDFLRAVIVEIINKFDDRESFVMLGPAGILSFIDLLKVKLGVLLEEIEE